MIGRSLLVVALLPALAIPGGQEGEALDARALPSIDPELRAAEVPHPLHLSTTMVAIDESAVFLRVRMFKNDLERALAVVSGRDSLVLAPTPDHDSLFLAYFGDRFELRFDGAAAPTPALIGSGEDLSTEKGDERIWWVELRYDLAPAERVAIRANQLYDLFDDQRNIVRVLDTRTERQRTLYFAAPDRGWSEVALK